MTMQQAMLNFLVVLVFYTPIFLLLYFVGHRRINRRKNFFLPFFALLYGLIANIYIIYKYTGTETIRTYLIYSAVLGLGFVVVKLLYFLIAYFVFKSNNTLSKLASFFYFYDSDYDKWFLKDSFILFRRLFLALSIVSCVVCEIYTALIYHFGLTWEYSFWLFLIIPSIIIIEIYNFLNGYGAQEYEEKFGGDDSRSARISSFYRVREVLEQTFAHEVLSSETGCDFGTQSDIIELLDSMDESEDKIDHTVSEFFRLNERDNAYDSDYISAVSKMMHGKNVVFSNPFYRDLGKYIVLPIMDTLLKGKNVLIITSRKSTQDDIINWMDDLLYKYGRIRDLWKIEKMSNRENECEVGVLSFSQLYDLSIVAKNKKFLRDVGFVFLSEPSYILNTGQIGLSVIAHQLEDVDGAPIYCVSDRILDGLVDTLSHVLKTEFYEVTAPPISRNLHTSMGWNADGDFLRQRLFGKQTRFLGNGVELAAVAVKNQIPEVSWYGERKVPILDIKWIAGQYYTVLCGFMNLPLQQEKLYEKIKFVPSLWCVPEKKEHFVIAEDEFMNLFSAIRTYLSRGKEQTFVNILSENYLLRDYMRCNYRMFITNPDAIPSIVPGYVKSERNTLIKLLYNMTFREVGEDEVLNELKLSGMEIDDAFFGLSELLKKYTNAEDDILDVYTFSNGDSINPQIKNGFRLIKSRFDEQFAKTLKIAYYVCEEEEGDTEFIDAKLIGHATQCVLPGQFVTYDGKYYNVQSVSSELGVVLRRASNLYDGRKYYRQIRNYTLKEWNNEAIISEKKIMDIDICKINVDFSVKTTGYLEMSNSADLRNARVIDLSMDPNVSKLDREYHNKTILQIKLPETNVGIRYTVSVLLSEIFKSVFPDGWQYLAVVSKVPDDVEGMLNYLMYDMEGFYDEESIYILEDSEMDLGLLEAIEKNLLRFLELATDFLGWHFEKMREPAFEDRKIVTDEYPEENIEEKKKRISLFKHLRNLFKGKKEKEVDLSEQTEETATEPEEEKEISIQVDEEARDEAFVLSSDEPEQREGEPAENNTISEDIIHDDIVISQNEEIIVEEDKKENVFSSDEYDLFEAGEEELSDIVSIDGTDIFDETGSHEFDEHFQEAFEEMGIVSLIKSRYQEECFLKFGFDEVDKRLHLQDVHKYLIVRGFSKNALRKARKRDEVDENKVLSKAVAYCEFCGLPLTGVSYERLDDGRIRCNDCSSSAINSLEEMKKTFRRCRNLMESFYAIRFNVDLQVKMADAKKIARGFGSIYKKESPRVLGYAQRIGKQYSIYLENGSPQMATIVTIVHELTHIWQYRNWKVKEIKKYYPTREQRDMVYEGMAVWASVQFLYLIGEISYATKMEMAESNRSDIYGQGFRKFCEKYPLIKDSSILSYSPFIVKIEDLL